MTRRKTTAPTRTRYQRTNRWIDRRQVQCECFARDPEGRCRVCGQLIDTTPHPPAVRGGFGWIYEYANGSVHRT
jgi:hypothetical protein